MKTLRKLSGRLGLITILCIVKCITGQSQNNPSFMREAAVVSPIIFAEGTISTGDYETHPAFSPSGDTLVFLKGSPDMTTWTLCISYFKNKEWTTPEVASFSGQYMDGDPFFSKDGKELYFISDRPINQNEPKKTDLDIWKVMRTSAGWSKPIHLDAPINSNEDEYYPTLTDNGTLYFGSKRSGGKGLSDIYRSEWKNGSYQMVENLGEGVNTADNEYEPFIAHDEQILIFMATRPNGLANADLYVSYRKNNGWTKAAKLEYPISSTGTEWSPKIYGKYFFFGSTRNKLKDGIHDSESISNLNKRIRAAGNGLGDIYQVDFSSLGIGNK